MWPPQLENRKYIVTVRKIIKIREKMLCYIIITVKHAMDNLHYRLTFDPDNKNEIPGKNLLKVVNFQNLVEKCFNVWKI